MDKLLLQFVGVLELIICLYNYQFGWWVFWQQFLDQLVLWLVGQIVWLSFLGYYMILFLIFFGRRFVMKVRRRRSGCWLICKIFQIFNVRCLIVMCGRIKLLFFLLRRILFFCSMISWIFLLSGILIFIFLIGFMRILIIIFMCWLLIFVLVNRLRFGVVFYFYCFWSFMFSLLSFLIGIVLQLIVKILLLRLRGQSVLLILID